MVAIASIEQQTLGRVTGDHRTTRLEFEREQGRQYSLALAESWCKGWSAALLALPAAATVPY